MSKNKDLILGKSISCKIKELREIKFPGHGGQIKCAESFGIKVQMWNGWESGRNTPTDKNQRKLAQFFGISVPELRGEVKEIAFQSSSGDDDAGAGLAVDISRIIGRFAALQERIHFGKYEAELVTAAISVTNELLDREVQLSQAAAQEDKNHSAG